MAHRRQFSLLQLLSSMLLIGAGLGFASLALRLWEEPWAHDIAILTPLWYAVGALFFAAVGLLFDVRRHHHPLP